MARPRRGLKVIAAFKFVKAGIMLAAGFAALGLVEGVGLAQGRRWAEYLAVISTSAFLPLEGLALWHHPTLIPAGTIILNVAVVVYLILHLSTPRQPSAPHRWHA